MGDPQNLFSLVGFLVMAERQQARSSDQKPPEGEGTDAAESPTSEATARQRGRPYQVELVEHALRENTIVNLGTGAGKTFVAVMTIKELASQTEGEFADDKGQRTVFLAHTGENC